MTLPVKFGLIIESRYFHKAESVIDERRLPAEVAVFGGGIDIGNLGAPQVCQVESAVGIEHFGKLHRDGLVFFPFQLVNA